jgi:hypothetical protein
MEEFPFNVSDEPVTLTLDPEAVVSVPAVSAVLTVTVPELMTTLSVALGTRFRLQSAGVFQLALAPFHTLVLSSNRDSSGSMAHFTAAATDEFAFRRADLDFASRRTSLENVRMAISFPAGKLRCRRFGDPHARSHTRLKSAGRDMACRGLGAVTFEFR